MGLLKTKDKLVSRTKAVATARVLAGIIVAGLALFGSDLLLPEEELSDGIELLIRGGSILLGMLQAFGGMEARFMRDAIGENGIDAGVRRPRR